MSCFFFFYFSNLIIWCYLSLFKYASPLFFLSSWIPYFMFLMTDLNSPQKGQRERDRERERGGERVIGREMLLPSVPVTGLGLCSCHTVFHNIEFFWEGPVVCAFFSCAPCECLSLSPSVLHCHKEQGSDNAIKGLVLVYWLPPSVHHLKPSKAVTYQLLLDAVFPIVSYIIVL